MVGAERSMYSHLPWVVQALMRTRLRSALGSYSALYSEAPAKGTGGPAERQGVQQQGTQMHATPRGTVQQVEATHAARCTAHSAHTRRPRTRRLRPLELLLHELGIV